MTTRIKLRRDIAANWTQNNPVLAEGEPGLELDTGKIKYGNGTTPWNSLDYSGAGAASLTDEGNVVITAGSTEHWIATQRKEQGDTTPNALRYDSEGNLYSLTRTYDDAANYDVTVITKYTATGNIAWQKTFSDTYPMALAVDSSDRAYITLGAGDDVVTVIKFEIIGEILWKKNYLIGPIPAYGAYIEEKSTTTLALAIMIAGDGPEPTNILVLEISAANGSVLLKKSLQQPDNNLVALTGMDVDPDENVFITGWYEDSGVGKMFIEKLDEDLEPVWSKSLEAPDNYDMYGGDCASDALGNIYVVGAFEVETTNSNINEASDKSAGILTKLNSLGVVQWTRRLGPGPCGSWIAGLTATATGDVYLSSLTFAKKTGPLPGAGELEREFLGQNKMIVVRYDTQGAVIWQRYVDVANLEEEEPDGPEFTRGQAIAVFDDKFAVDGYGYSWNTTPFESGNSADNEFDYFVTQLPTEGTDLTIGGLNFTESRVPARFVTYATSDSPLTHANWEETITAETSTLVADTDIKIANSLVQSETYQYTFGADGTLTIPNDGDLKLTQTQVGWFIGLDSRDSNNHIEGDCVAVDSQGYSYIGGDEDDDDNAFVMKISPEGDRLWSVRVFEDDSGYNGELTSLKIHPVTGNIVALGYVFGTYTYSILFTLDQDTGRILNVTEFKDSDGDVELNTIAWTSTGAYVIGGRKKGEFSAEFPVVPQTGSGVGTIVILRSAVPEVEYINDDWQIGGTGISPFQSVNFSERYTGLTGTTREGSGAVFSITIGGTGPYTYESVTATTAGTDYRPGHKIKVLGTDLEGLTPTNDAVIQVTEVDGSGGIVTATITGTYGNAQEAPYTYTGKTGTNFEVGSGLTFTIQGPFFDNDYSNQDGTRTITANGSNYVNGDFVVVPGTSLGGTSPANDLTLNLYVDQNEQFINNVSGTSQSLTWKIETTAQVDFTADGSWSVTYSRDNDCVLITPTWQRTFGTAKDKYDEIITLAIDSQDNIIAVGDGYGELVDSSFDDLSVVYKFNSAGTLQWARQLNAGNDDHEGHSVVTIGTDIYVVDENDEGDSFVSKLDSTGTVKWQRRIEGQDITIARTLDGNLLIAAEDGDAPITTDNDTAIKIFLLTPAGETVWKRWLSPNIDYSAYIGSSGECLVTDANSFYITGRNSTDDDNWAWAARLPLDGTGTGEYGQFCYIDVNSETNDLSNFNYSIDVVDIGSVNNYAGLLNDSSDPLIKTTATVTVTTNNTSDYDVFGYYPPMVVEIVRDTDGGNIVFADGTKQSTSATDVPQRLFNGVDYTLGMVDRGHHILCTDDIESIRIPYNARVEFPIGTVITIVNPRGDSVVINTEGGSIQVMIPGDDNYSNGGTFLVSEYGMATLLKIGTDSWVLAGNVSVD
jgi:hypothetical protein